MSVSLIAFIASGVGIALLIGVKMLQERLGLLLFWPDVRAKVDLKTRKCYSKMCAYVEACNKRTFYIVLHFVLVKVRGLVVAAEQKLDKRLIHLVNVIKGKRAADIKGTASHFLHDINRFKDTFRRQQ